MKSGEIVNLLASPFPVQAVFLDDIPDEAAGNCCFAPMPLRIRCPDGARLFRPVGSASRSATI
jgi:hypothetical protein